MTRQKHVLLAALFAGTSMLVALLAACDDGSEPGATSPTTVLGATGAAATPTRPAAIRSSTPEKSGITIVDKTIEVIASADPAALAGLIEAQQIACADVQGGGVARPACRAAPGSPPEGTLVTAFPYGTCEREWQFDLTSFAARWLDQAGELYAVVRLDRLEPEDVLPAQGGYAVIYTSADARFETAHALVLNESGIVAADTLCGGAAERFLDDAPPFNGPEVVFKGPAFD